MRPSSVGPSQRQLRAGELIRHALADIFARGDTGDPALENIGASVVEVQISPDLKIATAYIRTLVMGHEQELLKAANQNRKFIRGLIAKRMTMKFTPEIRFRVDTALDYASKIDALLQTPQVAQDLNKDE